MPYQASKLLLLYQYENTNVNILPFVAVFSEHSSKALQLLDTLA